MTSVAVLAGCGSSNDGRPARLAISVACVREGCHELAYGSGAVGLGQLWKGLARDHTRYALLIDKWLTYGRAPASWERDALSPGTCSRPAIGRAYLGDQGYFPYAFATMMRTSWSIRVFDGTKLIGCGSHAGDHPLRTNTTPLTSSGTITRHGNRVVITVGTKADDSRITLIPIHNDIGRPATRMVLRFAALNGSSDIVAALRRGTCKSLLPYPDIPLPDLIPDEDQTSATASAELESPLPVFERQQWVVELGGYFGADRSMCVAVTPSSHAG